jgi:hypothetical protein
MPSGRTQYGKLYLEDLGMQILHALSNPSSISGTKNYPEIQNFQNGVGSFCDV